MSDDDFLFADPEAPVGPGPKDDAAGPPAADDGHEPWPVLVVDDDEQVHSVTTLALRNARFKGRSLTLLRADSGAEAKAVLAERPDIAVILLDVVMETETAGLDVVRHVRDTLGNHKVQIILRTGQPGQAPEREVIDTYEINDYKAKTELTAEKLYTVTATAIRAFQYIDTIEKNRQGLEKIIDASASLFRLRSMKVFASGALEQISSLLGVSEEGLVCVRAEPGAGGEPLVLAGSGRFAPAIDSPLVDAAGPEVRDGLLRALAERRTLCLDSGLFTYIETPNRQAVGAYLPYTGPVRNLDLQLMEVFSSRISVGFDNVRLYEHLRKAHEATVVALADLAEYKDEDTGDHVRRVEYWSRAMAGRLRGHERYCDVVDDRFVEQVGLAAVLHDVGKVSIPDRILQKPGRLDADEWQVMKQHAVAGGRILARAADGQDGGSYLNLGAEIAATHHEKWDGSGYPEGLAGEAIPLAGRIVAVADVFDALTSDRPYKKAWSREEAVAELERCAGTQFDPRVVDAFLAVLAEDGAHPDGA